MCKANDCDNVLSLVSYYQMVRHHNNLSMLFLRELVKTLFVININNNSAGLYEYICFCKYINYQ